MKNTILVSITILSVCFFFIGQTSTKKDFDAEAKYRVLERAVVSLIQEKKKSDAKIEELESELNKVSARIKVHLATKSLESSEDSKNKKNNPIQLDFGTERDLRELQDDVRLLKTQIFGMNQFLGFGVPNDTLDDLKNAINGKANSLHFH